MHMITMDIDVIYGMCIMVQKSYCTESYCILIYEVCQETLDSVQY